MINYADDSTLVTALNSITDEEINRELANVYNWLCINKLSLNIPKTKFMVFHSSQKAINVPRVEINGIEIAQVTSFKFLGVTLDSHISWKPHINNIKCKISKTCGVLNKLKNTLPQYILKQIYQSSIAPHLNYGLLAWGKNPGTLVQLQKKAIRIIAKTKYNAHTDPLFKRFKILKLEDLKKLNELKFFHKITNSMLPEYFLNNFINTNYNIHNISTRNATSLATPVHRHQLFKSSLRYSIINTVNSLPPTILSKCRTHSLNSFTDHVKQFFFNSYPENCSIHNCYVCRT